MDPYDKKMREMQQYVPFLEDKIERMKKVKLKSVYPDPEKEGRLKRLQGMYKVITNRDITKKVNVATLEKFESVIKKIQDQDYIENRQARKDSLSKKDHNPYHNPDPYRPGSSCSNASAGSGSGPYRTKKVFDDTPASPSPPRSPPLHGSTTASVPIIIPTERRPGSRFGPPDSPPPPPPPPSLSHQQSSSSTSASAAARNRYLFSRSPSPPPVIPKIVPIMRVDANEIGPLEWDTDEEDTPVTTKARPEIVVPTIDAGHTIKKLGDTFARKEDIKHAKQETETKHHPSENIPTVQVSALGGARRLKSVIEKTNLLNTDFNRILSGHRAPTPLAYVNEEGMLSPDPEIVHQSPSQSQQPAQQPFSPTRRDAPKVPMTPSLLLNAPPKNSRLPIAIDDIAEYLDDSERNNLRKHEPHAKQPGVPRPPSRMLMPNSSPIMLSPRSDASTMSPCHTDPRLPNDPRTRPNPDPRTHAMGPMSVDPRSHGAMSVNDPRNHGVLPPNDPRAHGGAVPRYADNYERHKRSVPRDAQETMGPPDFQRQHQYGPESMVPPMHGVPNNAPGPGTYNPINQMGPMGFDYRMGPNQDGYGGAPGPMQSPQQQQWNGPPHPHMQAGPPQPVPPPYQMPQAPTPGWQNPNMPQNMYTDMQGHPMMNGDARMAGGFSNQMSANMARNNPPHIQPLMSASNNFGKYPSYSDNRPSYEMPPVNEFQRPRPTWGSGPNNRMSDGDRFTNRPSTPFTRPSGPPNSWNNNNNSGKEGQQRPNRDPRSLAADRDPRTRPEPHRPMSPPFHAKEAPSAKGPPGKEMHPNKLAKSTTAEKESVTKKRPDHHKSDTHKTKDSHKDRDRDRDRDRDKDRDRDRDRDKDKDKDRTKIRMKSGESMKSPLTDLYGAIDAKKAVQGPGLQKFKIPKKRPSIDTRPEPTPVTEENWDDDDVTSTSASHEPVTKQQPDSTAVTSKKSSKSDKDKEKSKSAEKDKESSPDILDTQERKKSKNSEIDILKKFVATEVHDNLSKDDLSSLVKELVKKLKKKKKSKKPVIYSSDDEDEEEASGDERRPPPSPTKKQPKKKKPSKQIIVSSEESEISSEPLPPSKKEKQKKSLDSKKSPDSKKASAEPKIDQQSEKKEKKEKLKMDKELVISLPDKRSLRQKAKEMLAEEPATDKEVLEPEPVPEVAPTENSSVAEEVTATEEITAAPAADVAPAPLVEEAPVKTKPKRRFRELDMLQEDLKSSWICDGAMKATGSRTCSQKNKPQEQQQQHHEPQTPHEEPSTSTAPAKSAAGKMKKPPAPKTKPGPKAKKPVAESILLVSSDSEEDDLPLSRRSEGLLSSDSSAAKKDATKKDAASKTANRKARAKSLPKSQPPLFDSSSNDSFNLDPSAVEPATDISLHPETSSSEKAGAAKGKGMKKGGKKTSTVDAAAESSSDESYVSNASSSLLLDTSAKQRDNNEELLDDVMTELATNPKYSVVRRKQAKKKKSNWQMGILSKKKRKKAVASNKPDDSTESIADSSVTQEIENDNSTKETDTTTSSSDKKHDSTLDRTESIDKLNEEEETVGWKSTTNVTATDDEDLTSRVDADALIGYTYSGNEKYQCLLCPFYRKNIVHHYKMQHPKKEVLISRLPVADANLAIEESKRLDFENNASPAVDKDIGKYSCRFCSFVTKGVDSCARESFYEHCTNHTGEYRFSCQNCSYEAVAKGSIRTHYYKECRKYSTLKNLTEAIVEGTIPTEDRIYGFLCTKCNYVQLKECNVEKHVKMWHAKNGEEVKIVKIDMSLNVKKENIKMENDTTDSSIVPQKVELKDEKVAIVTDSAIDEVPDVKENVTDVVTAENTSITEEEAEIRIMLEASEHKPEKLEKLEKLEKPEKSSNLSAFVCASELGDKDVEIQNERKKKMQEIVENIGIKVDKEEALKRISIIDKLKDKIETSLPVNEPESAPVDNVVIKDNEPTVPEGPPEDSVDPLHIPEPTTENENQEGPAELPEMPKIKDDPDAAAGINKDDKSSAKMKDPLAFVNEAVKRAGYTNSDEEPSDGEPSVAPVQYESDTSAEQSDHETDVSSILQNTGEIPSPSKGLMMTTIQRLAAQLQNTKPLESPTLPDAETIVPDAATVTVKTEKTSPRRPADDMAVLSPTRIKKEVKKEPRSPQRDTQEGLKAIGDESASLKQTNTPSPKTFIRIRRISGDKLSKGGDQEPASLNDNDQSAMAMATIEPIDSNTNEEDTGFLRIANVVSLAQKESDNQIVSNIRKAVETSPQKVKGLSVLKKQSSFILKRVDSSGSVISPSGETVKLIPLNIPPTSRSVAKSENYISIGGQAAVAIKIDSKGVATPLTMTSAGSAPTSLVTSTSQPFKFVKIAAPEQVSVAIKLKSANVYEKMLKDDKLIHMFKCMGRDCCFTTSSEQAFNKHLRLHEEDISNKTNNDPKDYFKCAYCYIDCKSYDDLMNHLKKMHIFCRYCCKYCFYRAFAYSYVEIHQKTFHQLKRVHILVVSEELVQMPPPPKRLDRKQIIKPYVCVHDCNKYFFIPEAFVLHLNMHHTNIKSSYKCHMCQGVLPNVDNLIEHYKQHGYFKYHCMYCTHGSASIKELHNHLSSAHYNEPPHILERCLPREISKNLSAIDQLRVRDVDAIYRQRKGGFEDEHTKVAIPSLTKNSGTTVSLMPNPPIVTAKIIKDNSTFVPLANLDGGVSNIRILDARSLSTNAATSLLNIGKNIKVTVTDAQKLSSNDKQFIHMINDDKNSETTNIKDNNKDDYDSDVEIIEDYTNQSNDATKEDLPIKKEEIKEETADDSKDAINSETIGLEPNSSNLSNTSSTESPTASKPSDSPGNATGRFLSLEDVKGTGFSGRELYRCGVESCRQSAETAEELRQHMQQCSPSEEDGADGTLYCIHCGPASKRFGKPSFFIDHLKTHGVKRFSCAVCNARFAVQSQAQSHLRAKHKYVSSRIVPADPMNPSPDGLFVVHPMTLAEKIKNKKLNKTPEKEKPVDMEKTTYGPSEIDKLPLQAIFIRAVQCAVCPYSNKVRTNVVRHLQAHLKDESVPDSSPVNPVPCLDKKERMFDKMVNLASSSHENGRMSGSGGAGAGQKDAAKLEEEEALPKYVPENQRYVCGVPECNYLTVEEAMLRHHLKALHSDEVYFRCPHCPPSNGQDLAQNIALEKMGVHLKMHDSRLYKCSHCIYHHYHRHVVERHLADKHPEKRPFVKVIRELQADQAGGAEAYHQQTSTSFTSSSTATASQELEETELPDPDGNTWKCNLCDFKCVYKSAMQNHAANSHDEKCQFKCNGCPFKTISKITFDQHMISKHANEPTVDFTTVYQRIRGLKKPDAPEPVGVQDEPFDTTPLWRRDMPRIRHIRGILLEEEEENETAKAGGGKRKSETEALGKPAKIKSSKSASLEDCKSPEAKRPRNSLEEATVERLKQPEGGYGPYGKPIGELYTCTVCTQFKSRYKHDFRDHLYRDLKYFRWHCPSCDYKAVNRGPLIKHMGNRHPNDSTEVEPCSPNQEIEEWAATVIKTQFDIMKNNKIAATVTALEEELEALEETDDDDLVIDMKEEEENDNSEDEKVSSEVLPAPLICKHCNMSFIKWRGFKRHVQLKHLKRLGFLCPYCDRSTNSEAVMLQHVRSKHRELPEKVIENPNPHMADLTAEFWEREYGLVVPKRPKKRKRKEENPDESGTNELPCDKCDFIAVTNAGLKSHLRTHETKVKQKCMYCTFSSFNASEMRQHWEVNHAHLEFKVEEAIVTSAAMDAANVRAAKKTKLEDEKKAIVYYCYYCDMGSTSLDAIRSHWKMMHKDDSKSSMFKYREHSEMKVKCAYCAEPGSKSILVNHIWQRHGKDKSVLLVERDEDGWICKWCREDEFLTSKEELDYHQKMFHSHLRMNYKLVRRSFSCKQCNFETPLLEAMQKHAKVHLNVYKCKHCTEMFKTFSAVKNHFKIAHPDKEAETRTITGDDLGKEIENIVNQSAKFTDIQLTPIRVSLSPVKTPPTSPRLAKKSTTKQALTTIRPYPGKIKAVARKSTNPLPRYPSGVVFETEEEETEPRYVSYYGRATTPVDLSSLSTTMALAGLKMKVNCAKLAELFNINIEPTLKLVDFRKSKAKDHR